jgi:hypothetical protein
MKERILHIIAAVILAACFIAGVCIIFDVLHAMDGKPNNRQPPPATANGSLRFDTRVSQTLSTPADVRS